MAHPKRRKSKAKVRTRRSHHALKASSLTECPNCRQMKMPHRVCPNCGFYKDRVVS